jgi:hypothetical protein
MEIGEPVSVDVNASVETAPTTGDLVVIVTERTSEEPIMRVKVTIAGPSSGEAMTDDKGEARFSGIPEGSYSVKLSQKEFEMTPDELTIAVAAGSEQALSAAVKRVMITLVIKRIHIQGLLKAARGDKSDLEYGHWWIEIDGRQSYGWWPANPVGMWDTFTGTPGVLNGQGYYNGSPTRDPKHTTDAEEMFHPCVLSGQSAIAIKAAIRAFATGYSGSWSWPWGQNCHSFQEAMMERCHLTKSGSKKVN